MNTVDTFSSQSHYFILTPWEYPVAYVTFGLHWFSSLICIAVSLYFFRQKKGAWWVLIALAFALPLVGEIIRNLRHGLPPLPYSLAGPIQELSFNGEIKDSTGLPQTQTGGTTWYQTSQVSIYLDPVSPLVAMGLAWAYLAYRSSPKSC
jgi:hypothetical protein